MSYRTVSYIKKYIKIFRKGVIADAKVVGYTIYRSNMFLRNASIPVFSFITDAKQHIEGAPIHSFFIEIITYQLNKSYKIKYDKVTPTMFVIVSKIEMITAIVMLALSLIYICWFIFFISSRIC